MTHLSKFIVNGVILNIYGISLFVQVRFVNICFFYFGILFMHRFSFYAEIFCFRCNFLFLRLVLNHLQYRLVSGCISYSAKFSYLVILIFATGLLTFGTIFHAAKDASIFTNDFALVVINFLKAAFTINKTFLFPTWSKVGHVMLLKCLYRKRCHSLIFQSMCRKRLSLIIS